MGKPEVISNWLFSKQRTHELTIVFLWFFFPISHPSPNFGESRLTGCSQFPNPINVSRIPQSVLVKSRIPLTFSRIPHCALVKSPIPGKVPFQTLLLEFIQPFWGVTCSTYWFHYLNCNFQDPPVHGFDVARHTEPGVSSMKTTSFMSGTARDEEEETEKPTRRTRETSLRRKVGKPPVQKLPTREQKLYVWYAYTASLDNPHITNTPVYVVILFASGKL